MENLVHRHALDQNNVGQLLWTSGKLENITYTHTLNVYIKDVGMENMNLTIKEKLTKIILNSPDCPRTTSLQLEYRIYIVSFIKM